MVRRSAVGIKKGMGCKAPRGNGAVSADVSGSSAEAGHWGNLRRQDRITFEA